MKKIILKIKENKTAVAIFGWIALTAGFIALGLFTKVMIWLFMLGYNFI